MQLQGPRAFNQPEIIARLRLTDLQRQAIWQIEMEAFASAWAWGNAKHQQTPPGNFRETVLQPAVEKILKLLTREQLTRWRKLAGPSFHGVVQLPPPGPLPPL